MFSLFINVKRYYGIFVWDNCENENMKWSGYLLKVDPLNGNWISISVFPLSSHPYTSIKVLKEEYKCEEYKELLKSNIKIIYIRKSSYF